MREIKIEGYKKEGKKWMRDEYTCSDPATVYERLAADLTAKYLNKGRYITRITRVNNYDGTQRITVTYDNDFRNEYTVPEHI